MKIEETKNLFEKILTMKINLPDLPEADLTGLDFFIRQCNQFVGQIESVYDEIGHLAGQLVTDMIKDFFASGGPLGIGGLGQGYHVPKHVVGKGQKGLDEDGP
jgi:hypothetical protein